MMAYIYALEVLHLGEIGRSDKDNKRRKLGGSQHLESLGLHVQNGDESLLVYVADGLQFGAVHGVLVRAVLQVLVVANVPHHFLVGHKVVVFAVLFVFAWKSRRVWSFFV